MQNDRGAKKWTAMMMPEQINMLNQMWEEQEYKEKPIIDEQKMFEINTMLQLALHNDLTIKVEYYDTQKHDYLKIKDKLLMVDNLRSVMRFDNDEQTEIELINVLDVSVD